MGGWHRKCYSMGMTSEQRYSTLQAKAQATAKALSSYLIDLDVKYGNGNSCWAGRGEQTKLAMLKTRADKASGAFFASLLTIQGRDWASGIPCYWIIESLTFADATTTGQLSVVPPAAWGFTDQDSKRFAQMVIR